MAKKDSRKLLYWFPRIVALLFSLLIIFFAISVIGQGFSWATFVLALIPGLILIITTIIAWRYEVAGGTIFVLLGVLYLLIAMGTNISADAVLIMSGIPIFTGALFVLDNTIDARPAKAAKKKKKK